MNAMLVTIFLCLGVGLLAARFGERVYLAILPIAVLLTSVYLFLPRYM
jgi:hypothetical protein